ncbi:hypothetical protein OAN21_03075, partial [Alphaproteobacteria bacterium]|nr:hypothetical protein [Alphaproteobacteria bacterium]
ILFLGVVGPPLFCFSMLADPEAQSPRPSPAPSFRPPFSETPETHKKYDIFLMKAQAHSFMRQYKKAFIYYSVAASFGSAEGIDRLGVMYSLGQSVPKNNRIAIHYFKKAARLGYGPSAATLFSFLEEESSELIPEEKPLAIEALKCLEGIFPSYAERIRGLE